MTTIEANVSNVLRTDDWLLMRMRPSGINNLPHHCGEVLDEVTDGTLLQVFPLHLNSLPQCALVMWFAVCDLVLHPPPDIFYCVEIWRLGRKICDKANLVIREPVGNS